MTTKERLIEKLFQGTSTREELESLMDMIEHEQLKTDPDIMEKLWNSLADYPDLDASTSSDILDNTLKKIALYKDDNPIQDYKQKRRIAIPNKWFAGGSIAATIILMIGIFWGYQYFLSSESIVTATTSFGEWKHVVLPDGSEVVLNANSSISYSKSWKKGNARKVNLKGEAFFKVAEDPQGATFTVSTKDVGIIVLGTTFNVHTRGDETKVFLEEGKVKLDLGNSEHLLSPGDFVSYSSAQKSITSFHKSQAASHTSWKDGSLIINDRTVEEIFEKIKEIYGYEVKTHDETLLKEVKTIAIPMDRIEIAIPILEKVLNVHIELNEDQLLVKK